MTTPPSFPSPSSSPPVNGLGWSVHKKPKFSTIVASHVSGREVRYANYVNPIWEFEVTFDGLDSSPFGLYPNLGAQSLQTLMGFFLTCQGQYGTFLFTDPTDSLVTNGAIATGDGATTTFTFSRFMGTFFEPVGWVLPASAPTASVYLNGVLQSPGSAYSIVSPNSLVFTTAPPLGIAITATFTFAFQCRFAEDANDFEQFMSTLWRLQALTFRSVRTS